MPSGGCDGSCPLLSAGRLWMPSAEQSGSIRNGKWRIGPPVDASGRTPESRTFDGIADYKRVQLEQPEAFTRALVKKFALFLAGRT